MAAIEGNSSNQFFLQFSEALDSLNKGEEPKNQDAIPPDLRLHLGIDGKRIAFIAGQVVSRAFDENKKTKIESSQFSCFLERWQACQSTSLREKGKVVEQLVKDHLKYSPYKLIETLQKKPASTLSSAEVRSLEKALEKICYEHKNFAAAFYSYCFSYFGTLFSIHLKEAGANLKINQGSCEISVDWEKVPLSSPEAITLAARYLPAKKTHALTKLLREVLTDLSSYDDETRKVLTMGLEKNNSNDSCIKSLLMHF